MNSPPKSRIFLWTPKILKFFILNPILSVKSTKFLVKISQFQFLVMTEKNVFVYKLFLSLNISDFSLSFFLVKIATPLKKVTPSFPATTLSKLRSCQAPHPPPPAGRGACTLCDDDDGDDGLFLRDGWPTNGLRTAGSIIARGTFVRKPHHRDFSTRRGGSRSRIAETAIHSAITLPRQCIFLSRIRKYPPKETGILIL